MEVSTGFCQYGIPWTPTFIVAELSNDCITERFLTIRNLNNHMANNQSQIMEGQKTEE
jgi:hypothetical protein